MYKYKFVGFALLLLILLMLCACTDTSENEEENISSEISVTDSEAESQDPKKILNLINEEKTIKIIHGMNVSDYEITAAKSLANKLQSRLDCEVFVEAETKYDENAVEIVIGSTGYPESDVIRSSLDCYGMKKAKEKLFLYRPMPYPKQRITLEKDRTRKQIPSRYGSRR